MKTRSASLLCLLALAAASLSGRVLAADDSADQKKTKEELQQATKTDAESAVAAQRAQDRIEALNTQRKLIEKDISKFEADLADAKARVEQYSKINAVKELEQSTKDQAAAQAHLDAAQLRLTNVKDQISEALRALQSALNVSVEKDIILPGDTLDVVVLEDENLSRTYTVREGGYILMSGAGRIKVAGKDLASAEKAVKDALAVNQIKNATVMVDRAEGKAGATGPVIYLTGEFMHPGPWVIPSGYSPSAVTAILRSGGVNPEADLTRVRVLRLVGGQGLVEEVNVQAILDGSGLTADLPMQAGDIIVVPAVANSVYVTGNVLRPGILKMLPDDELTAYSAILRSGGFARFADRGGVYVLRDRGDGQKQRIPVSIKALQSGKTQDVILQPKDIIVVPEKFFSF